VNAKRDEEDLPCTKDLTRGTKDVNNRNVGRKDPRTTPEASAKGTSAECANRTLVLLTGEPHETQNVPRNSLPLTLRLPIDGKPGECKQEAANGVVTAERTKGTVGMAEPNESNADVDRTATLGRKLAKRACGVDEGAETDADVDRTAALGGEPAERVQGVGEGDETERDGQSRLKQTNFYCKEDRQRNENANADVPSTYKLPLEGEWLVCASGEASDWNGDANASNAAIERVVSPSESRVAEDTPGVESEGCEGGTSGRESVDEAVECCQQLCMADIPNESDMLVTVSIVSESPDGGGIPRVHLGGTRSRAGDANGAGNRADASSCQADASKGSTDVMGTSDRAETDGMSSYEGAGTYLGAGDATNGVGSPADALTGHWDVPSVGTDAITTANAPEIVSIPRKREKPPDSPMETARRHPDKPNGCGSRADGSSVRRDVHRAGNESETATNGTEIVRSHRIGSRTQDSPETHETATPKPTRRWRKVSVDGGDVYVPWNAPVEVLGTANRRIVFGRVERGDEAIAPSVEGETAGGRGDGRDGDANGMTSGGDADSTRVEAALLAAESQHTRYSSRLRRNDLPVSSWPPIQPERRPYGHVRRRRRCGRLKIEQINEDQVSKAQRGETTHLTHAYATQPPGNAPNRAYGIVRPRHRRGRIKIVPTNVSRTRNGGNAYLGRANAMRSTRRPKKRVRRVNKLTCEFRMPEEPWRDIEDHG